MIGRYGPLLEFAVVALFALGWGLLELHTRRLDRLRERRGAEDAALRTPEA